MGAEQATSLAERYFRPKAIEIDGRLYRWLGVTLFKRMLMALVRPAPGQRRTNGYALGGFSLDEVRKHERLARRNEVVHLLGLVLATVFFTLTAIWGGLLVAGLVLVAANFHCFLLQRYNRARIYRILGRQGDRQ